MTALSAKRQAFVAEYLVDFNATLWYNEHILAIVRLIVQQCSVQVCDRKQVGMGYCNAHRTRFLKGYRMDTPIKPVAVRGQCTQGDCDRPNILRGVIANCITTVSCTAMSR